MYDLTRDGFVLLVMGFTGSNGNGRRQGSLVDKVEFCFRKICRKQARVIPAT
jgi:hypothetical protein